MKLKLKVFLVISILLIITSLYALFSVIQDYERIKRNCDVTPCIEAVTFLNNNTHLIFGFGATALTSFLLGIMLVDLIKQKD